MLIILIAGVGTVALLVTSSTMAYTIGNVSHQCENSVEDGKNTTVVYVGYTAVVVMQGEMTQHFVKFKPCEPSVTLLRSFGVISLCCIVSNGV